jgi:hypothetical protein
LFLLPFTWGRHRRARATTALPRATSLELLILFGYSLVGDTVYTVSRNYCPKKRDFLAPGREKLASKKPP